MIFQLNGSEMADWQDVWCGHCAKDHLWSHAGHDQDADGCPLILKSILGEDVPQFIPHTDWFRSLPANVSCSSFEVCDAPECQDAPDAERRGGETRREFHDRLRAGTIALPIVEVAQ